MREVLKVYDVTLTVEGPVHIGNGCEIGKKEYVYLPREKKVVVLDPSKLYQLLSKKGMVPAYVKFQLGSSRDDIGKWLVNNRVSAKEYLTCAKYQLDCGDSVVDSHSKLEIREFIKDAYGLPYVPGSSIKGMLRTILQAYDINENPKKYGSVKGKIWQQTIENQDQKNRDQRNPNQRNPDQSGKNRKPNRNQFLKGEVSQLEELYYRTLKRPETQERDAVNDILSGMIVGDSAPLSVEDLILCQRTELHEDGEEKKINVLREALRPGTVISFPLTIDTGVCAVTKEYLEKAIAYFAQMHYQCFLQKFRRDFLPLDHTVWLGGGSGFVTKTEVYPLFGSADGVEVTVGIFKGIGVDERHKHSLDRRKKVSPHVCKIAYYRGKRYLMGACRVEVVERGARTDT